jgi:hypothetical protein
MKIRDVVGIDETDEGGKNANQLNSGFAKRKRC